MRHRSLCVAAVLAALVVAIGVPAATSSHPPPQADATAVVAAWNLAAFTARPQSDAAILARGIADVDAEVLGLVEVNPPAMIGWIVEELNGRGLPWYRGQIIDQSATQDIGVLYKDGVDVDGVDLIPGSDDENTGLRKALTADAKVGEFDFKLVVLHMKAGRGSDDHAVRDAQADAIASWITANTAGDEKDVLIVGDYNMVPGDDDSNFTRMGTASGFIQFISSEDLMGQFTHIASDGGPGNLLDGYGISAVHTGEYVEGSLRIFPLNRTYGLTLLDFRNDVSDHLPVLARFRITQDDDGT